MAAVVADYNTSHPILHRSHFASQLDDTSLYLINSTGQRYNLATIQPRGTAPRWSNCQRKVVCFWSRGSVTKLVHEKVPADKTMAER